MIIYVDIDGTICNTKGNNYEKAEPIKENIAKINKLFDAGNRIVYWSARGGTHGGKDLYVMTYNQLNSWNCKYHRLELFTKPSCDLFIDDRAKRIEEI